MAADATLGPSWTRNRQLAHVADGRFAAWTLLCAAGVSLYYVRYAPVFAIGAGMDHMCDVCARGFVPVCAVSRVCACVCARYPRVGGTGRFIAGLAGPWEVRIPT